MRSLSTTLIVALLFLPYPSFAQQQKREKTPALRSRIHPANGNNYRPTMNGSDWKNPFLIVRPDGIEVLLTGGDASDGATIPVAAVIGYLEKFPDRAWPYGLVVGMEEVGARSGDDDSHITKNRLELMRRLRIEGVKIKWWPTG